MDAIAERVQERFAALAPEQRTVEGWARLVFQEILRETAAFLAHAVVRELETQPRLLWMARARLVRQINRRIALKSR